MRLLISLGVILIVLIGGGAITSNLLNTDFAIHQTSSPDASPFVATPDQASAFFILVSFVIFNLFGAGVTAMAIFWFLNRGIKSSQAEASASES